MHAALVSAQPFTAIHAMRQESVFFCVVVFLCIKLGCSGFI